MTAPPLVAIHELGRRFPSRDSKGRVTDLWAVRHVDLEIAAGETVGLVGESGCGKSTLARCLLRLIEPSRGRILFDGNDITHLSRRALRRHRRRMQIIFQDPVAALNPRMTVHATLREPLAVHALVKPEQRQARIVELLERVGLGPELLDRYPHELSGGQRQRLGIARALSVEPDFIVADEPVSALDVSIQAQVINLLLELRRALGLTYLFITHDMHLIRHVSDRVVVMYLGRIVEEAPTEALFATPAHPYTRTLIAATPRLTTVETFTASGEPPSPTEPPPGCAFHPRCPNVTSECRETIPQLRPIGDGRRVACHVAEECTS